MMKLGTYDLVATVGHYKDRNGVEKKQYQNCGKMFVKEGKESSTYTSIKLESIPVGPNRSGRFSTFPIKKKEDKATQTVLPSANSDVDNDEKF